MRLRIKRKGAHLLVMSKLKVRIAQEVLIEGIWDAVDNYGRAGGEVVFHACDCDVIVNPTQEEKKHFKAKGEIALLGDTGTYPLIGEALLLNSEVATEGVMSNERLEYKHAIQA